MTPLRMIAVGLLMVGFATPGAAQGKAEVAPLFEQTFESPESLAGLRKRSGGEMKDNSIDLVDEGVRKGQRSARISFTPTSGRHWYFSIPTKIRVDSKQLLKLEGHLKFEVGGRLEPLLSIQLGLTYNVYTDDTYTRISSRASVHRGGGLYSPGQWEHVISEPFNLVRNLADRGRDTPYLEITRVAIMVLNQPLQQQLTILADDIRLAPATEADVVAYEKSIRVDHDPAPYLNQAKEFHYGYTGGLYSGWTKWSKGTHLIPKEKRALNNIEFMLKGNFTQVIDYSHRPDFDGNNAERIASDIELLHGYGMTAMSLCYLTPYYDGSRSLADCEAAVRKVVPILAKAKGFRGYVFIDEPRPERKSMDLWLWGKKLYRELDPANVASGPLNTHDRIRFYTQTEHTVWIDEYPFRGRHFDSYDDGLGGVFSIERVNEIAYECGAKQTWNMNPVFSDTGARSRYRFPTLAEHRLANYMSLANGARTLHYFAMVGYLPYTVGSASNPKLNRRLLGFGTSVGAPMHPAGREVFRQRGIAPVYGPLLMGTTWERERVVPVACEQIKTPVPNKNAIGVGYNRGKEYDIVVVYNRDLSKPQSGTVTLTDVLKGRDLYDLYTNQSVPHDGGVFRTPSLAPGDGRIYLLASPAAAQQVAASVAHTRFVLLKRLFDFYYREQRHNKLDMAAFSGVFSVTDGDVKRDPARALRALARAYVALKRREQGTSTFARTHSLLKKGQAQYVTLAERQVKHLSRDTEDAIAEVIRADGYVQWQDEAVRLSDIYVLLRNLLYFGHTEQALAATKEWAPLMAAILENSQKGIFTPVNAQATEALHARALALNDFDMLQALRDNLR